jgi:hypothetical protein
MVLLVLGVGLISKVKDYDFASGQPFGAFW